MNTVGLVGTGLRSDIVAHLLRRSGVEIQLWTPREEVPEDFPESVSTGPMEALRETHLIFVCLPMHRIRHTIRELGDVLNGRHLLVHTTRTLEPETLAPISSIFEEETPTRRFGFLTGPMRREDVLADRGASALCASPFPEIWEMVGTALDCPRFRVYRSEDLEGSEVAAAYARVIAMAYGMCSEMDLGGSILSTLFARGLDEMAQIVTERGGRERTTFGLSGAGNLHADTTGTGHTDFRIGRRYAAEESPSLEEFREDLDVIEDELFVFLETLISYTRRADADYYILRAIERSVFDDAGLDDAFEQLMQLPEFEE